MSRMVTRFFAVLAIAVPLTGLSAVSAMADSTAACADASESQPFTHWADFAHYVQTPGGTFESGLAGWKTTGGARLTNDNEPWDVSDDDGDTALTIPSGSSVTSPSFCAGLAYPDIRLFARSSGGALPLLHVDVIYTDRIGLLVSDPLGVVLPSSNWQPSLQSLTLAGLPLLSGSKLALRFTAIGGTFTVDDVYVDPFQRMR